MNSREQFPRFANGAFWVEVLAVWDACLCPLFLPSAAEERFSKLIKPSFKTFFETVVRGF